MKQTSTKVKRIICLSLLVASTLVRCSESVAEPLQLKVLKSIDDLSTTAMFQRSNTWTGADGAYSADLGQKRSLWLFGDTFIGSINRERSKSSKMINNTVAVQNLDSNAIEFYWKGSKNEPRSIFEPDKADTWFWPGTAQRVGAVLYVFLHRERRVESKEPAFGFASAGDVLAEIGNPDDTPHNWKTKIHEMPKETEALDWGIASFLEGEYFYVFSAYKKAAEGMNKHPLMVSRIPKAELAKSNWKAWQHLCFSNEQRNSKAWSSALNNPVILIADAAPEMSISSVPGIPGYIATYMPGFDKTIVVRYAKTLEGPWGERLPVYQCPEKSKKVFLYSAKAHPELSKAEGELLITYCRNTWQFADQMKDASIYFPQAIKVKLKLY